MYLKKNIKNTDNTICFKYWYLLSFSHLIYHMTMKEEID